MLQLKDETPFCSALALLADPEGIDTLYVATKATFRLGKQVRIAPQQVQLVLADEFWGEPGESSLKYAGEVHLSKPSTDVALVGSAHAPNGQPVDELDVFFSVGPVHKTVRVVGDREWTGSLMGPAMSDVQPFTSMPLVWERAFGGVHVASEEKGKVYVVGANPVGQGVRSQRRRTELKGQLAPNLLDRNQPKRPASLGFVAASWEPRIAYAGTYDESWQKKRAPYLPLDFDSRFFNAAHPDLICPGYLQGGESVVLENLSSTQLMQFELPTVGLDVTARVAGRVETPVANLETVLFEPDELRFTMLWRAALACDKEALEVEEITIAPNEAIVDGAPT